MPREGSKAAKLRSRFIRTSAKPGAKRKAKSILMLGGKNIGKTCLAKRFTSGEFLENHVPTVEDRYASDVNYKDYQVHIEIVDIDAFEFPAMRDLCVKEACVIMLLYEVGHRKSFDMMKKIYDVMKDVRENSFPIVIVGTKADKMDSKLMADGQSDEYVDEFLEEINCGRHMDLARKVLTSAKIDFNVTEAFHLGIEDIVKTMNTASLTLCPPPDTQKSGGCCVLI